MDLTGKEIVIFDSNAYRYLVSRKTPDQVSKVIGKVVARERENSIISLTSPVVLRELMVHLRSKKDRSFEKCLNAIRALYLHSGSEGGLRAVADHELLISRALFGVVIPGAEFSQQKLADVAYQLVTQEINKVLRREQAFIQHNQQYVNGREKSFANQIKTIIKKVDPAATGWQLHANDAQARNRHLAYINSFECSLDIASSYYSILQAQLRDAGLLPSFTVDQINEQLKLLLDLFGAAIELWKEVFRRMINGEFDLGKSANANFIWDIQLMFNVGDHTIKGAKTTVVTTDKAMGRVAHAVRHQYRIYTYNEYMGYLGLPVEE